MANKGPAGKKSTATREGTAGRVGAQGGEMPKRRPTEDFPRRQATGPGGQSRGRNSGAAARPTERREAVSDRRDYGYSGNGRRETRSRLDEVRSEKRDRFVNAGSSRSQRKGWMYIAIPLLIVAAIGVGWYFLGGSSETGLPGTGLRRSSGLFTKVVPENGAVKLPVADFQDGKAKYYTYGTASNKEIDFFVLKSSDGVIRAAIDSCDVCFSYRKGYHQEGDEMVCNNCGQRFPSVKINVIKGGCNPAPLTREVQGDSLVINEKDILTDGDQYF